MKQQNSVKPESSSTAKASSLFAAQPYQVRPRTTPKESGTLEILRVQEESKYNESPLFSCVEEKLNKIEFEKQQRGKLLRGGESGRQSISAPLV